MPVRNSVNDLTWNDIDTIDAQNSPGLLPEIARAARTAVCNIYESSPAAIGVGQKSLPYIIDVREVMLDRLCRPIGKLPPSRTAPFLGGQCEGTLYEVRSAHTETRLQNGQFFVDDVTSANNFYGPIRQIRLQSRLFLKNGGVVVSVYKSIVVDAMSRANDGTLTPATFTLTAFTEADNRGINDLGQLTVTPLGGNNACGNPPEVVPSNPPTVNNFNSTANLTINNNVSIPVAVTVVPTLIAPVGVVVRPELNVDVGGVRVTIDPGGMTFTDVDPIAPGKDIKDDPRELPPSVVNHSNNTTVSGGGTDLTGVLAKLDKIYDELQKCCDRLAPFPEPSTDEYDVQLLHEGTGGTFNLPSRTFTVTVEILDKPGKMKTIDPTSGERVLFCGWAWFHSQGGLCERMPLDADKKAFKPPERAENKVTISCYSGYTCRVRAWYAKPDA